MLTLAGDAAIQTKLGIADKKAAIEKLATESREAGWKAMRDAYAKAREMEREERNKFYAKMGQLRVKARQATDKKFKDLLGEAKYKQLMEIRAGLLLRERGPMMVADPGIAAILKLTDEQKKQIQKVVEKFNADRRELFRGSGRGGRGGARGPRGGDGAAAPSPGAQLIFVAAPAGGQRRPARPDFEKMRAQMEAKTQPLRKAANKAISAILTQSQKDEITRLIKGVEGLEMPQPQFGRGGMGGGREGARRGGGEGGRRRGGGGTPQ
ncbi:MAG: hypothetical protein ACYSWU_00190 [Planctomycetota bacterium]